MNVSFLGGAGFTVKGYIPAFPIWPRCGALLFGAGMASILRFLIRITCMKGAGVCAGQRRFTERRELMFVNPAGIFRSGGVEKQRVRGFFRKKWRRCSPFLGAAGIHRLAPGTEQGREESMLEHVFSVLLLLHRGPARAFRKIVVDACQYNV